jgi:hypothetical protein
MHPHEDSLLSLVREVVLPMSLWQTSSVTVSRSELLLDKLPVDIPTYNV